jgi:phosphatidylethanolamine-binding protein (PEBP) family uncharacterized protein
MGKRTRHLTPAALCAALAAAAFAGCGGSGSGATTTGKSASGQPGAATNAGSTSTKTAAAQPTAHVAESQSAPTVAKVEISSPVVVGEGALPSRYTCDGADISPPLHWQGIPPGTKELMLDILNLEPVNGELYFDWAVTGINPKSHGTKAGSPPPGAIVGTNSAGKQGYTLCPPRHGTKTAYLAVLFALPHHLHATPDFDAATLRRDAEHTAQYEGFLGFHYTQH